MKEQNSHKGNNKRAWIAVLLSLLMLTSVSVFALPVSATEDDPPTVVEENGPIQEEPTEDTPVANDPAIVEDGDTEQATGETQSPVEGQNTDEQTSNSGAQSTSGTSTSVANSEEETAQQTSSDATSEDTDVTLAPFGLDSTNFGRADDPEEELPDIIIDMTVNEAGIKANKKTHAPIGTSSVYEVATTGFVNLDWNVSEDSLYTYNKPNSGLSDFGALEIRKSNGVMQYRYTMMKAHTDRSNLQNDGRNLVENLDIFEATYTKKNPETGEVAVGKLIYRASIQDDQPHFEINKNEFTVNSMAPTTIMKSGAVGGGSAAHMYFVFGADGMATNNPITVSINDGAIIPFVQDEDTKQFSTGPIPGIGTFTIPYYFGPNPNDPHDYCPRPSSVIYTPENDEVGNFKATFFAEDGDGDSVPSTIQIKFPDKPAPDPDPAPDIIIGEGSTGPLVSEAGLSNGSAPALGSNDTQWIEIPTEDVDAANVRIAETEAETELGSIEVAKTDDGLYKFRYILNAPVRNHSAADARTNDIAIDVDRVALEYYDLTTGQLGQFIVCVDVEDDLPGIHFVPATSPASRLEKSPVAKNMAIVYGADGAADSDAVTVKVKGNGSAQEWAYNEANQSYKAVLPSKGTLTASPAGDAYTIYFTPENKSVTSFDVVFAVQDGDGDIVEKTLKIEIEAPPVSSDSESSKPASSVPVSSVPVSSSNSSTISEPVAPPETPASSTPASSSRPRPASSSTAASSSTPASSSSVSGSSSASHENANSRSEQPIETIPVGGNTADPDGGNNTGTGSGGNGGGDGIASPPQTPQEWVQQRASTLKNLIGAGVPTVTINGNEIPLYGGNTHAVWALLNLLLALAGFAISAVLFVFMLRGKKKQNQQYEDDEIEQNNDSKKHYVFKVLGLLSGLSAVLLFLLTENINNLMVFFDNWTPLMLLVVAVQLVFVLFARRTSATNDEKQYVFKRYHPAL